MPYRLAFCILTCSFTIACADNAGDHANPLMIFAGQLAQGSLGSNSEALSSGSTSSKNQPKIAKSSSQNAQPLLQSVPLATDFGNEPPAYVAPLPVAPPPHGALIPAPVDTPW